MRRGAAWLCVAALAVFAALGSWYAVRRTEPGAIQAFAERYAPMEAWGFAADDPFVSVWVEGDKLHISWPDAQTDALRIESAILPAPAAAGARLDLYAGGRRNADGLSRDGYRVRLEFSLLDARGERVACENAEIPLESVKERARLYSLVARGEAASCRVALVVEAIDGTISAGTLQCSYMEVLAQ